MQERTRRSISSEVVQTARMMNIQHTNPHPRQKGAPALDVSILMAMPSAISRAASRAWRYARTITVGCIPRETNGSATTSISPARIITLVVPSPTSSSWLRASSNMDLAAGWATSISLRIAFPSLVITMPPMGSSSILSIERGPNVVRTMSDTACKQDGKADECCWRVGRATK
jgi:hypothetical protein